MTRMDTSVALPLCALSACRSARIQSLIRVLAIAGLIVAGSMSGAKATADGLKAFQGTMGETHKSADFTPAAKSYRLSGDLRDRLSQPRVSEKQ